MSFKTFWYIERHFDLRSTCSLSLSVRLLGLCSYAFYSQMQLLSRMLFETALLKEGTYDVSNQMI